MYSTAQASALKPGEAAVPHNTGSENLPPAGTTAKLAGLFLPMTASAGGLVTLYENGSGAQTLGFQNLISSATPDTVVLLSTVASGVNVTSEEITASHPVSLGAIKYQAGTFTMAVPLSAKVVDGTAVYLWDPHTNTALGGATLRPVG